MWKVGLGEWKGVESGAWRVCVCGKWGLESGRDVRVWGVGLGEWEDREAVENGAWRVGRL